MNITFSTPGECDILVTRLFNAPRHLVYEANTKPELVKRWLGVRNGWILAICEVDARVGGEYRFVWRKESNGKELKSRGTYREVLAPERTVCTEIFEDFPDESIVTTTYEEQNGKTTLSLLMAYPSREVRDMVLRTGMELGIDESYDVLEAMLKTIE